jgi:hypothetical protein
MDPNSYLNYSRKIGCMLSKNAKNTNVICKSSLINIICFYSLGCVTCQECNICGLENDEDEVEKINKKIENLNTQINTLESGVNNLQVKDRSIEIRPWTYYSKANYIQFLSIMNIKTHFCGMAQYDNYCKDSLLFFHRKILTPKSTP